MDIVSYFHKRTNVWLDRLSSSGFYLNDFIILHVDQWKLGEEKTSSSLSNNFLSVLAAIVAPLFSIDELL